jgi:hypothetical protein
MVRAFTTRRLVLLVAAILLVAFATAVVVRARMVAFAVRSALGAQGASDISFEVDRVAPWRVSIANLDFKLADQGMGARRVVLTREGWWRPSLGHLRIEEARIVADIDALAARSVDEKSPHGSMPSIPLEEVTVDGTLVLRAEGVPDRALTIRFNAKQGKQSQWQGNVLLGAPGLEAVLAATIPKEGEPIGFEVSSLRLEVETWQSFLEHWAPLPLGPWEIAGVLTASGQGQWSRGKLAARGQLRLQEGKVTNSSLGLAADGVEAAIDFTDIAALTSGPSSLRVKELRAGKVTFENVAAGFSLAGTDRVVVSALEAHALGGALTVEPFEFAPSRSEVSAVVTVDGISAEEVMALTQDLPARASGPLSGRLPVHFNEAGVRFGTGWLGLKPGATAEIQFHADGLLTAGTSPRSPSYAVLKKVEDGLLTLRVTELRLDIRPPDAPAGRTAQLRLEGEPVDKEVKAPVKLDLNVNGPLESLLNLGLKSGAKFGTKP